MTTQDYEIDLKALFPSGDVTKTESNHYWLSVEPSGLRDAVRTLKTKFGITHLSTIVAEDMRDHFLVSYIMSGAVVVVLKVKVDRNKPEVPSLSPVLAGSTVYEREIYELFGIIPIEHPDLRRQVLPEDWPQGLYPLRKDVTVPKASVPTEGGDS